MVDPATLNTLADELLCESVLFHDQEAVIFEEVNGDLLVKEQYQQLRLNIYDLLDNALNKE